MEAVIVNHSVFRKISLKTVFPNHLNKKQISDSLYQHLEGLSKTNISTTETALDFLSNYTISFNETSTTVSLGWRILP